jgi:hypothetical protein
MNTAELGRHMLLSRDLLEAPFQDILRAKLVKASMPSTFVKVCSDLRYSPRPFPNHQDFLVKHEFQKWVEDPLKPWAKKTMTPFIPKKGRN